MLKIRHLKLWLLTLALGGGTLSGVAQLDLPMVIKGYALLLPLQVAALLYVAAWYRRDRKPFLR
ncbi:MAG: hypothetical protein O3A14_04920 [Cyanobacteria bacterium]|nr:hypothetical protein [Cyanobacteriota bacterium]